MLRKYLGSGFNFKAAVSSGDVGEIETESEENWDGEIAERNCYNGIFMSANKT